jgi:hypothetical protein
MLGIASSKNLRLNPFCTTGDINVENRGNPGFTLKTMEKQRGRRWPSIGPRKAMNGLDGSSEAPQTLPLDASSDVPGATAALWPE